MLQPTDGISLANLFKSEIGERAKPIPFNFMGHSALIDNKYKLLHFGTSADPYELYDLSTDPKELHNLISERSDVFERLKSQLIAWQSSLQDSVAGKDYSEGRVREGEPEPKFWTEVIEYEPYFEDWRSRPEYKSRLRDK